MAAAGGKQRRVELHPSDASSGQGPEQVHDPADQLRPLFFADKLKTLARQTRDPREGLFAIEYQPLSQGRYRSSFTDLSVRDLAEESSGLHGLKEYSGKEIVCVGFESGQPVFAAPEGACLSMLEARAAGDLASVSKLSKWECRAQLKAAGLEPHPSPGTMWHLRACVADAATLLSVEVPSRQLDGYYELLFAISENGDYKSCLLPNKWRSFYSALKLAIKLKTNPVGWLRVAQGWSCDGDTKRWLRSRQKNDGSSGEDDGGDSEGVGAEEKEARKNKTGGGKTKVTLYTDHVLGGEKEEAEEKDATERTRRGGCKPRRQERKTA